uniref:EC15 protein n=1 Tax=Colletotrichum higginsianum TaxID=80884 RepID=I2G788_9PEZI|nr:EC15 protein [Colletotrichum higginsianum]
MTRLLLLLLLGADVKIMTGLLKGCCEAEEVVNAVLNLWKIVKDNGLKVERVSRMAMSTALK